MFIKVDCSNLQVELHYKYASKLSESNENETQKGARQETHTSVQGERPRPDVLNVSD